MPVKGRFTEEHNKRIIKLIKQKICSTRNRKHFFSTIRPLPANLAKISSNCNNSTICSTRQKKHTTVDFFATQFVQPARETSSSFNEMGNSSQKFSQVIERAQSYLKLRKREQTSGQDKKISFARYLELFSQPIESKTSTLKPLVQLQEIQMNIFDADDDYVRNNHLDSVDKCINDEERSSMNAKMRMKFNHRKIIDISKRH